MVQAWLGRQQAVCWVGAKAVGDSLLLMLLLQAEQTGNSEGHLLKFENMV